MQKNIQEHGPEDFKNLELITIPELRAIRRIWVNEKHEFDDSVPRIYKEVIGKEFVDPEWIGSESFGKEEWDILMDTCQDLYGDEELMPELMASLIDVEVEANGMAERKGILEKLDRCVRKTFYKNEEDATEFYSKRVNRQKDVGGKYDEKFLEEYVREHGVSYAAGTDDEDVDA